MFMYMLLVIICKHLTGMPGPGVLVKCMHVVMMDTLVLLRCFHVLAIVHVFKLHFRMVNI